MLNACLISGVEKQIYGLDEVLFAAKILSVLTGLHNTISQHSESLGLFFIASLLHLENSSHK